MSQRMSPGKRRRSPDSNSRKTNDGNFKGRGGRRLGCEALEPRQMLSANTGGLPALQLPSQPELELLPAVTESVVDSSLGARDQSLAISAVTLRIDGREFTINSLDQPLPMEVGSSLQIVGIDYRLGGERTGETAMSGRIAFEGYLNKLHGSGVRTDYSDGRFGGHVQEGELPRGSASHPGLQDAWKMEAGTESLTLVMVRYGRDEVAVEDRITIRTQVGTPDFVIHPEITMKGSNKGLVSGKQVKIYGAWGNMGQGTYRNYAEVDIVHESDPSKILWVGTLADGVDAGDTASADWDQGQFRNKVQRDGFSKSWIPELGGKYTLKFYADPESRWTESNEDNNVVTLEVEVRDLRQSARGKDATHGFGFNHHSVVDAPADNAPAHDAPAQYAPAHDAALTAAASGWNASPVAAGPVDTNGVETLVLGDTSDGIDERALETTPRASRTNRMVVAMAALGQDMKGTTEHSNEEVYEDEWQEAIDAALSMPPLIGA